MQPAQRIEKARRLLAQDAYMLAGELAEAAGLDAYHAALAYILMQSRQRPKTHPGGRYRSQGGRLMAFMPNLEADVQTRTGLHMVVLEFNRLSVGPKAGTTRQTVSF